MACDLDLPSVPSVECAPVLRRVVQFCVHRVHIGVVGILQMNYLRGAARGTHQPVENAPKPPHEGARADPRRGSCCGGNLPVVPQPGDLTDHVADHALSRLPE